MQGVKGKLNIGGAPASAAGGGGSSAAAAGGKYLTENVY